jgi:hypothetical protein
MYFASNSTNKTAGNHISLILQQNAYMASIKGEDYKMLYAGEGELKGT